MKPEFTVDTLNQSFEPFPTPGLQWTVNRISAEQPGGPKEAQLTVYGSKDGILQLLNFLHCGLAIYNRNRTACWWGEIVEVQIHIGPITIGLKLDDVRNKIAVRWSQGDLDGQTSWAQDDNSVALYGVREHIESGTMGASAATWLRSTLLALRAYPHGAPNVTAQDGGGMPYATVYGRGWWRSLSYRYYSQSLGLFAATNQAAAQLLGWGFSGALGFSSGRIHQIDGKFAGLLVNNKIVISGLAVNNGTYTVKQGTYEAVRTYTAGTISFAAADDIFDSANGFDFVRNNQMIQVTGSAANSRYHLIDSAGAGHLTTDTGFSGAISNESAGPSITIKQGNSVQIVESVTTAVPGTTATVTADGVKVAQSFVAPASWDVGEILIYLKAVGGPADNVVVSLCSDSGSAPSTVLSSSTVAGSAIGGDMGWVSFVLSSLVSMVAGTTYWIVAERSGANSSSAYYVVSVDEDLGYSSGALRLWTGAAWAARTVNANLAFQVIGHKETTKQIADIVTACGQFLTGTDIVTASGLNELMYRAGEQDGLNEAAALLAKGDNSHRRLLATVTPDRRLRIEVEPTPTDNDLLLTSDGLLRLPGGLPLEPGVLPVGQWITLADIPQPVAYAARVSPFMLDWCECDGDGNLAWDARGVRSLWDVGGVVQG